LKKNIEHSTSNAGFARLIGCWEFDVGCWMFLIKSMNTLDKIVAEKKMEVARLPKRVLATGDLRDALLEHGDGATFSRRYSTRDTATSRLIAEVKKASPSQA